MGLEGWIWCPYGFLLWREKKALRKKYRWNDFSLGKLLNKTHRCVKLFYLYNSHKFQFKTYIYSEHNCAITTIARTLWKCLLIKMYSHCFECLHARQSFVCFFFSICFYFRWWWREWENFLFCSLEFVCIFYMINFTKKLRIHTRKEKEANKTHCVDYIYIILF